MRFPLALILTVFSPVAASSDQGSAIAPSAGSSGEPGQTFILQDFLWVPVIVGRAPTAVECRFQVVKGHPTVRAELLSERDFFLFSRHRDYDTLALTDAGLSGRFQRVIETPGLYRLLIRNDPGAPPASVSLVIRTEVDPVSLSTGVSPRRKRAVIAMGLALLAGTVLWPGRKLLRAYRSR